MKYILLLTIVASTYAATPCDNIRTRAQWGSQKTTLQWMATRPPVGFAIHHTEGARCTSQAACDAQMRSIQNFHIKTRGWADIGYNFCIGDLGQVYEGRGYGRIGAHAVGFNRIALGHCFMGSHMSSLPTAAALSNTQAFIECSRARGQLSASYWVSTHRNDKKSNTDCPGNALYNRVASWPRFHSNP
jgi:N-acetylmuramoyl-L-alanine amidase